MIRRRTTQAYPLVARSGHGSNSGEREQEPLDFLSSKRIRMNIRAVLDDKDCFLTAAYSLAIQAEHLLQVAEGKRTHSQRAIRAKGHNRKWGPDKRAELLADPRTHDELAEVYECSASAISQQRLIARREAA